jgi:hypothetical protein
MHGDSTPEIAPRPRGGAVLGCRNQWKSPHPAGFSFISHYWMQGKWHFLLITEKEEKPDRVDLDGRDARVHRCQHKEHIFQYS